MKVLKIIIFFGLSVCIFLEAQAQKSVSLRAETKVYCKNTLITLIGIDFYNEGEFTQDSSTLLFSSIIPNQDRFISGKGSFSLSTLDIQVGKNTLLMENDLKISQALRLVNGNLNLNTHTLLLGEGGAKILGEGGRNQILGEGIIEKHIYLNNPLQMNPGNLGIEISAEDNLGKTVIRRIQERDPNDSLKLIHRQFEVETSFISASPIQLCLSYSQEDNPFGKNTPLVPMEEQANAWNTMAYYQFSEKTNAVDVLLTEAKKSWHIGLSPEKISSSTGSKEVPTVFPLDFQVYPNPFDGFVFLHWNGTKELPVEFQLVNATGSNVYTQKLNSQSQEIFIEGIPELPEGIYMVKILTDKGNTSARGLVHKK